MKPETARTAAVLALLAACLYLLHGVLPALAWAGLLAVGTWPLHERIVALLGRRGHGWSAALLTAVIVVALLLPLAWLIRGAVVEAPVLLRLWTASKDAGLAAPDWLASLPWIGAWALRQWNEWLAQPGGLGEAVHGMAGGMGLRTGRMLVREAGHAAMSVFFCVLVLFFLYRDGDTLVAQIDAVLTRQFGPAGVKTMRVAVRAARGTVNGLVLVGLGVGVAMSVAYAVAGVPHPALWGLATGLLGIVPFGAAVVLAGVVLFLASTGAGTTAVVLASFGMVLIFVVDHFVRPLFIAGSSRLPLVLALLGIVAGLETFGVLGIFLGPTLLAVMAAMWRQLAAGPARAADAVATEAAGPPAVPR